MVNALLSWLVLLATGGLLIAAVADAWRDTRPARYSWDTTPRVVDDSTAGFLIGSVFGALFALALLSVMGVAS